MLMQYSDIIMHIQTCDILISLTFQFKIVYKNICFLNLSQNIDINKKQFYICVTLYYSSQDYIFINRAQICMYLDIYNEYMQFDKDIRVRNMGDSCRRECIGNSLFCI